MVNEVSEPYWTTGRCAAEQMMELVAQVCEILRRALQNDLLFILNRVPVVFVAPELVRASPNVMPLGFNSKIVAGWSQAQNAVQ